MMVNQKTGVSAASHWATCQWPGTHLFQQQATLTSLLSRERFHQRTLKTCMAQLRSASWVHFWAVTKVKCMMLESQCKVVWIAMARSQFRTSQVMKHKHMKKNMCWGRPYEIRQWQGASAKDQKFSSFLSNICQSDNMLSQAQIWTMSSF